MMNEWGIPTVQLECLLYQFLKKLDEKGAYIPPCAMAGGFSLEDHVFKAFALGAPYIKAVCIGRATIAAAMVGNTVGEMVKKGKVPPEFQKYGKTLDQVFFGAAKLKEKYGKDFEKMTTGAVGMYTYYERLTTGLQQLMAGARKFALKHISRDDIVALTREASDISGIPFVMESDWKEVEKILK